MEGIDLVTNADSARAALDGGFIRISTASVIALSGFYAAIAHLEGIDGVMCGLGLDASGGAPAVAEMADAYRKIVRGAYAQVNSYES